MSTTARAPRPRTATRATRPSPRPTRPTRRQARAAGRPPRADTRSVAAAQASAVALRREERARSAAQERPALQVVTPVRRPRLRLLGALACLLLFGALLGLAVFHSVLVQGQLGLDRLDEQIQQEQETQRELRRQVAELTSPERILAEAATRGMVPPDRREYLPAVVPGQVVPPPGATE